MLHSFSHPQLNPYTHQGLSNYHADLIWCDSPLKQVRYKETIFLNFNVTWSIVQSEFFVYS
jgi:hypothetical protein